MFVQSPIVERSFFPYAVILQVTPIVAIAPLIIILVKNTQSALIICATIIAIFPVISNTTVGLRSIDAGHQDLFAINRASRLQSLVYLRIPSALPYFFAGLRISSGLALIGAVVAEFVAGTGGRNTGLAYQILQSGFQLDIPRMFAALFLITLAGVALFHGRGRTVEACARVVARQCDRARTLKKAASGKSEDNMLTTKQKVLRRFWYAVMPLDDLAAGPKPFRLLGEDIVLFLGADGKPAALKDRCCHRTAKLSKGWCKDGQLVCGYHGWTYDRTGKVVEVPQLPVPAELASYATPAYHCEARYGYAWVALDEPLAPILDASEETRPSLSAHTAILRGVEHLGAAADGELVRQRALCLRAQRHFRPAQPAVAGEIPDPGNRLRFRGRDAHHDCQSAGSVSHLRHRPRPTTKRHMRNKWYMPFCRKLDIEYPSGLRHIIFNSATPIDDDHIQVVQWLYRNDTEADCSAKELIDWDYQITREDKDIIELTDPDTPIDMARRVEAHMPSDRPGMIMRRRLKKLLEDHGEAEAFAPRNAGTPVAAVAAE